MYACAYAPLDKENITLVTVWSGDELYAFIRGFYNPKGLPNAFLQNKCTPSFNNPLIKFLHVYFGYIFILAHSKTHMLEPIEQLHQI